MVVRDWKQIARDRLDAIVEMGTRVKIAEIRAKDAQARAEAAEAKVRVLEAALQRIINYADDDWSVGIAENALSEKEKP